MNLIKKYRLVILIIVPVVIMVLIRTFSSGNFKYNARKWAERSFNLSNLISPDEAVSLAGDKLIIRLDDSIYSGKELSLPELAIPPDSVLSQKYLRRIRDHKGPVILSSADQGLSARIWMIMSQTGITNLYILTDSTHNESFKYEFRPDTMAGTEL
jgi:hypothetical protein